MKKRTGSSIEVFKYTKKKLLGLRVTKSEASMDQVKSKSHTDYFDRYLNSETLGVKTIIVENDDIDKDFLEDFSAYSLCQIPDDKFHRQIPE